MIIKKNSIISSQNGHVLQIKINLIKQRGSHKALIQQSKRGSSRVEGGRSFGPSSKLHNLGVSWVI
jgi:hypothetical protein